MTAGNFRRSPAVGDVAIGTALGVLMVFWCHGALMQLGLIDPWLYTGFILGFRDLATEFGATYYSLRVAFLLPAILFDQVFGSELGYRLLRVAMLVALFVALARVARVFVTVGWARALAALAILHPWVWRSVFWNYIDGAGLTYTAWVLVCVVEITESKFRWGRWLAAGGAGIFLALATNTNLFLFAVAGALGIWPLVAFAVSRRWAELIQCGCAASGGFVAGAVGLMSVRWALAPAEGWVWDIFALGMGAEMVGAGAATWHESVVGLIRNQGWFYLLVPVVVAVAAIAAAASNPRGERRGKIALAAAVLTLTIGIYVIADFGLKAAVISLFYYFVYAVPAVFLAGCGVVGWILNGGREARSPGSTAVVVGVLGVAGYLAREWVAEWSQSLSMGLVFGGWMVIGFVGLIASRWLPGWTRASWIVVMTLGSQCLFFGAQEFYTPLSPTQATVEIEALAMGIEFRDVLDGMRAEDEGKVGFWFANDGPDEAPFLFDGLNGLWLWGYSRLHTWAGYGNGTPGGMPDLTEAEAERLPWFAQISVLAESRADAERGIGRLRAVGWDAPAEFREFQQHHLRVFMATVPSPELERKRELKEREREREEQRALRAEKKAQRQLRVQQRAAK